MCKECDKKTKKITDIPIRTKLIPIYADKEQVNFVKNRNCFVRCLYKKTGKVLRPLWGIPKR